MKSRKVYVHQLLSVYFLSISLPGLLYAGYFFLLVGENLSYHFSDQTDFRSNLILLLMTSLILLGLVNFYGHIFSLFRVPYFLSDKNHWLSTLLLNLAMGLTFTGPIIRGLTGIGVIISVIAYILVKKHLSSAESSLSSPGAQEFPPAQPKNL